MTATAQLDLDFSPRLPSVPLTAVEELMRLLQGRDWTTAREIMELRAGWRDREIREIASLSEGQIVSGQQGYKLTLACTPEEVHHATAWLRSQARHMTQRSVAIEHVFHRAVHTGEAPIKP